MSKIEKIFINDFRGFDGQRTLNFDSAELVVFLGMNGFGKTSVFDAVEWCLTGHIGRYERYLLPGRRQDFSKEKQVLRNKYSNDPNSHVKVFLSDGTRLGRRVSAAENGCDYNTGSIIDGYGFGLEPIAQHQMDPELAHNYFSATHILSQETINHFVTSKRPEDRYRALAVNFGTSQYEPFEHNAQELGALLEEKEKELSIRSIEGAKRLYSLESQLQVNSENLKELLAETNQVIDELRTLAPNLQMGLFYLTKDNIVRGGLHNKDSIALVSHAKSELVKWQNEYSTVKSLIAEFDKWSAHNKELEQLDLEIIQNKQLISQLQEIDGRVQNLWREISCLVSVSEDTAREANVARDTSARLLDFIEIRNAILGHREAITARNAVTAKIQVALADISKITSYKEEEVKASSSLLRDINSVLQAISAQRTNSPNIQLKREHLINKIEKASVDITAHHKKQAILEKLESVMWDDSISISPEEVEECLQIIPTLDRHLIDVWFTTERRLSDLQQKALALAALKASGESRYEDELRLSSKTVELLMRALDLVDPLQETAKCPVCEDIHLSRSLISSIKQRVEKNESQRLDYLRNHIQQTNAEITCTDADICTTKEDIRRAKSSLAEAVKSTMSQSRSAVERKVTSRAKAIDDLNQIDEDRRRLFASIEQVIKHPVYDLQIAQGQCEKLFEESSSLLEGLKTDLLKSKAKQIDLTELLNSHVTANRLAQQQIDALSSSDYQKVEEFLFRIGLHVDDQVQERLTHYIEELDTKVTLTAAKISFLNEEALKSNESAASLRIGITDSEINNKIIAASARVSELARFVSGYRDRCSRLGLDLGKIAMPDLVTHLESLSSSVERTSSTLSCLERIEKAAKDFSLYNREDTTRKSINSAKNELEKISNNLQSVKKAKAKLTSLRKTFPKILEQYIKSNLDVSLFNKIYHSLNPHRRFKHVDFLVKVSHNKVGINFRAKQSNVYGRPEYLFSSAQLNTFGVSMFLSMALRQNWLALDTILLDDPIQNLDDINILSLIDLLRGLVDLNTGKQIIMSTHDERFYHLVKKKFADYKVKAFRFESYGRLAIDES